MSVNFNNPLSGMFYRCSNQEEKEMIKPKLITKYGLWYALVKPYSEINMELRVLAIKRFSQPGTKLMQVETIDIETVITPFKPGKCDNFL